MSFIDALVNEALEQKLVTFNKHGVGAFNVSLDLLPSDLKFDRLNLHDVTGMNGNLTAQIRRRKGYASVVFNVEFEG